MKLFVAFISAILLLLTCAVWAQGPNDQCPTFCPYDFKPVCGYNGDCYKQFSNQCALDVANCYKGGFEKVDLSKCQERGAKICPS